MISKKNKKGILQRGFQSLAFICLFLTFLNNAQTKKYLPLENLPHSTINILVIAYHALPSPTYPENLWLFQLNPYEKDYYTWLASSLTQPNSRASVLAALSDWPFTEKFSFLGQNVEHFFRTKINDSLSTIKTKQFSVKTGFFAKKPYTYNTFSSQQQKIIDLSILASLTLAWTKALRLEFDKKFIKLEVEPISKEIIKKRAMVVALMHVVNLLEKNARQELETLQKSITDKIIKEYLTAVHDTLMKDTKPFDLSAYDIQLSAL